MAYWSGVVMGKVKKICKLQKKVTRLISNVGRNTSCWVLFKTLNILPLPCRYVMEIVYCVKMKIGRLEQNSVTHIIHVIDEIFNPSSLEQIFKKEKSK